MPVKKIGYISQVNKPTSPEDVAAGFVRSTFWH